jgi:hypothetical protein
VLPAAKPAVPAPSPNFAALYREDAEHILAAYRESVDSSLDDFDWQKAEVLLQGAISQGDSSPRAQAELALAKGYATLQRLAGGAYSDGAAAQLREEARADFAQAIRLAPADPAPHLAMARLYVYAAPDVAKAMSEFGAAERLGAKLGRREIEQQADAYRLRADRLASRKPRAAWNDAQKARALYARIRNFDQVESSLHALSRIRHGRTSNYYAARSTHSPRPSYARSSARPAGQSRDRQAGERRR